MKIKETYTWFTGLLNPGNLSLFINVDKNGVEEDINSLAAKAITFNRVVIFGKEPFEQKEEIGKLIKRIRKDNFNNIIEIYTKGTIRPILIGKFKNIIYNVNVQLKNSKIQYQERIKEGVLTWFNDIHANFLFYVDNKDDIDEAELLIKQLGIKKRLVYLTIKEKASEEDLQYLIKVCKLFGYNFALNFGYMFWPKEDKKNERCSK